MFVDALDEASRGEGNETQDQDRNQTAQDVVNFLSEINEKLINQAAGVKICFSCRRFPSIAVKDGFEISVDICNRDDIASYTAAELDRLFNRGAENTARSDTIEILRAEIVSKAEGVFLWVPLAVKMVAKKYNDGKLLKQIQQTLRQLPSDVEEMYRHILKRVVDVEDRPQTLHLMQWIFLARRPLSVKELRFALASDDSVIYEGQASCEESDYFVHNDSQMEKQIISLSGGLAEVKTHSEEYRRQDTTVQFIHQSVNDFLAKDQFKCLALNVAEDLVGQGHHRLARSCINFLKLDKTRQEAGLVLGLYSRNVSLRRSHLKAIPFVEYAAIHWRIHAEHAEKATISQEDLVERLEWPHQGFLQEWVEIHGNFSYDESLEGCTVLHLAASSNLKTTLRRLLKSGVAVEIEDENGDRAMHYAAREGYKTIIDMLLDAHAIVGPRNQQGETPLSCAARAGHRTIVTMLLEHGGISDKMRELNNALIAAAEGKHAFTVGLLIQMGADVNAQGGHYGNALQAAAFMGSEVVVGLLLDSKAAANAQGGHYGNALQAARISLFIRSVEVRDKIVRLLLKAGAKDDMQNRKIAKKKTAQLMRSIGRRE